MATIFEGQSQIRQSCCNHWDCPVCGSVRAAQEYRRIVEGAGELAESYQLYFLTITCRGKDCTLADAQENYYAWTNILLSRLRAKAKSTAQYWSYAQVTERQKRGHPHSHILSTYCPTDVLLYPRADEKLEYFSAYFERANIAAGLGWECRISQVLTIEAASRYIGKYLFKKSAATQWPAHWRRVRYSRNWPPVALQAPEFALPLLGKDTWQKIAKMGVLWRCDTIENYHYATYRVHNVLPPLAVNGQGV